ncbi:MAG: Crp/Fnr family transcriptional regulator [Alphaproteobacteria bacterium]|jgi:CRP-like cAMP-binding protein|nr:Crp/Fnr family transcriptional regulator [Alphaproteobacteria bacterium]MDP6515056.1 Crp/Fnr family transcriptional regulator [Alphaproteobacteria bacterium]|tara:strand:+ start:144 stop:860 length:717 start_codon:yes stop_codon:yes gene_type:complete
MAASIGTSPTAQWRAILSKHFLLRYLDAEELDQLLTFARQRRCVAGELLFQKGDAGDSLLAILNGHIKISTLSGDGKEIVLNILGPGELFGEIALIDGKERSADAHTMEPSELLVIDGRDFMPFLNARPELSTRLLVVLCERIRWVSDLYEDAVFLNLPSRLAKHLMRLAASYGETIDSGTRITLKLSQQDLGNLLGTSRESINKQLRAWQATGLISVDRGLITIHRADEIELLSQAF